MRVFQVPDRWEHKGTSLNQLEPLTSECIEQYDESDRPELRALSGVSLPDPKIFEFVILVMFENRKDSGRYCVDCELWLIERNELQHYVLSTALNVLADIGRDVPNTIRRRFLCRAIRKHAARRAQEALARVEELEKEMGELRRKEHHDSILCRIGLESERAD